VWLAGSVLLAATGILVGCAVTATVAPVLAVQHPSFTPGTACDAASCHTPAYFHPSYTHKEPYLGPCDTCHNLVSWKQAAYTHKNPVFSAGTHNVVGCATCHTEGKPNPDPACTTCHKPPHKGWTSCPSCHGPVAWRMFNSLPAGHVSLEGSHAVLVCLDCHKAPVEPVKARTCVDCHGTHHGGLTQCYKCHSPATGWNPKAGWTHSDFFVLRGIHKTLDCAQCHVNNKFQGLPKVCVGCHGRHHGGLTDCASCHTTSAFKPPTFDHSDVFALSGAHGRLACTKCHPKLNFTRAVAFGRTIDHTHPACGECHLPHHGGLTDCGACHTTSAFKPAKFDHSNVFILVGQHAVLYAHGQCSGCHPCGHFAGTPTACVACHAGVSPHGSGITDCGQCHTPAKLPAGFSQTKPFPAHPVALGTHHLSSPCTDCHPTLVFSHFKQCSDCHAGSGVATTKVPHVGPSTCFDCHTPTVWNETHFVHPLIAGSPHSWVTFGPYPTGCATSCHPGLDFTTNSCTNCHL
jgi:hypothetical protein